MRILIMLGLLASASFAQPEPEIRQTAARALPMLERSAANFVAKRACISCHHNFLPILAFHLARDRGISVNSTVVNAVEENTFRGLLSPAALDDAVQTATLNDPTPNDSYLLMVAHSAGLPADMTTGVYAQRLAAWQRNGHWVTSDFRPPHSSSAFTATATAVRAIRFYMPEERREESEAVFLRARQWLVATTPVSTEDASFRLMGLAWAGAPVADIDLARRDLLGRQTPAGGWPQLAGYAPDAYSTGEALFALHEARTLGADRAWRKGLKFLITTQAADGTWRVHTRMISPATVSPAYFATGFPYQKDEFLSYAGSCWAFMALLTALPDGHGKPEQPKPATSSGAVVPPWVRTALFGTPQQLAALLEGGLDPNSKTNGGTTLLMMAAPDAEKVRLLLARGADAKARTASGCDALTIASAYRGTAAAIQALLDAGVETGAPKGVRMRHTPLVLASMTGDLENVKLLLAHGADPSAAAKSNTPLAAAVTFGYPDVVRTLLSAGADASGTESTGINLLHWAVIAGRPDVIPDLVTAGVPVNAVDEFGFTPLMYAATIDFGDSKAIQALLKAGADPKIRNGEGRTARQEAHDHRLMSLEAALRIKETP